jgi:predicted DNA-binding transcriptional regulator AlpA
MNKPIKPSPLADSGAHLPGALLHPKAAANFLDLSEWTLAQWRCKGVGPRFVKLGNRVRYSPAALAEWVEAHTAASTSEHDMKKVG